MFLLLLVDRLSAIVICLVGLIAVICISKFCLRIPLENYVFSIDTGYILLYQIIIGAAIGILFTRRRDIAQKYATFETLFINLLRTHNLKANQKSVAILRETYDSYKDQELNPREELLKLRQAIAAKDSTLVDKEIQLLDEYYEVNSKKLLPYCTLDVSKINTQDLVNTVHQITKAIGIESLTVDLQTKAQTINCDVTGIYKVLWKLASQLKEQLKDEEEIYFRLAIRDTTLSYVVQDNDKDNRNIEALSFTLAEDGYLPETLFQPVYDVELVDAESIRPINLTNEEMSDIEDTVLAHYGQLYTKKVESNTVYQFVIPTDVYKIRPMPLDLLTPLSTLYNWPPADDLESELRSTLATITPALSISRIDRAIKMIKVYHFYQKRHSGEPYYMHPLAVTKLLLTILDDKKSTVYAAIQEHKEDIIIASLLHDITEDTAIKEPAIGNIFGLKVLSYVQGASKVKYDTRARMLTEKQAFGTLIDQMPEVVYIKLADRLHNLLTIDGHSSIDKRKKIAQDTLDYFVPAAAKYNLQDIVAQMTGICNYILKNGKIEGYGR